MLSFPDEQAAMRYDMRGFDSPEWKDLLPHGLASTLDVHPPEESLWLKRKRTGPAILHGFSEGVRRKPALVTTVSAAIWRNEHWRVRSQAIQDPPCRTKPAGASAKGIERVRKNRDIRVFVEKNCISKSTETKNEKH